MVADVEFLMSYRDPLVRGTTVDGYRFLYYRSGSTYYYFQFEEATLKNWTKTEVNINPRTYTF